MPNLPFELICQIIQYLDPIQLLHLRLVSHAFKVATTSIIRQKLFIKSRLQLEVSIGPSGPANCIAVDVSDDMDICEWAGNAKRIRHVWDSLHKANTTIHVTPSPLWAWFRPYKSTYDKIFWTEKPIPKSSPNLYDTLDNGDDIFWRHAEYREMPWDITFCCFSSDDGPDYYVSVKLNLLGLIKIYGSYREKFRRWKSWQPEYLTSGSVAEAEYYLEYFTLVNFEAKELMRNYVEFPFENMDIHGVCKHLPF